MLQYITKFIVIEIEHCYSLPKILYEIFMELFTTMVQRGIRFVSDYFPLFAAHLERYLQLTNQAFCYKIGTKCIGYMLCQMLISYKFQIVRIHQVERTY